MNYTLQVHGERHTYPVPPGLNELVSDVTREVLRHQPADLTKFIAEYLDSLLRIRNALNVGVQFRAQVLQESTRFADHFIVCGFSHDELTAAARLIQRVWRGYAARRRLEEEEACRRRNRERWGEEAVDWAEQLEVRVEDLLRAVRLIQERFRQFLKRMLSKELPDTHSVEENSLSNTPSALDRELQSLMFGKLKTGIDGNEQGSSGDTSRVDLENGENDLEPVPSEEWSDDKMDKPLPEDTNEVPDENEGDGGVEVTGGEETGGDEPAEPDAENDAE